jgi:Arc/MetJ family transcription regulator
VVSIDSGWLIDDVRKAPLLAGPVRPAVAFVWHDQSMSRTRVSTTVDEDLLASARRAYSAPTDAALLDEALAALVARHRSAEIDASYAAYDEHPLEEPDAWGDLASFREAAAAS